MKVIIGLIFVLAISLYLLLKQTTSYLPIPSTSPTTNQAQSSPLSIIAMKQKSYPGSTINIEEALPAGPNYDKYIVSYQSEDLKQYALLTIPQGQKPEKGWPVIIFNHGYIPPAQYSTVESYTVMINPLAQAGYIVIKPDYRGNDSSEGNPEQIYISPSYVTDSMNALASIKKFPNADPNKIGIFGHSMGGNITLHQLVITGDIKAAELAAGVVGNETDILNWWQTRIAERSIAGNDLDAAGVIQQMIKEHGTPETNPSFWKTIDPTEFITEILAPIQIQVGLDDSVVPASFSASFRDKLQAAGKSVDYIEYPGANHNLSPNTQTAMQKSIEFFDKYLK